MSLGISGSQLGVLLSAFFWTYACLQLVSGWLVDRLNVNWVIAAGFFLGSAATAGTGIVHTFATLFVLRLMHSASGSQSHTPPIRRSLLCTSRKSIGGLANLVISAGLGAGARIRHCLMGGMLMARFGWRSFFVVLGMVSLLWLVPWIKWMPVARDAIHLDTTGSPESFGVPPKAIGLGDMRWAVLQ